MIGILDTFASYALYTFKSVASFLNIYLYYVHERYTVLLCNTFTRKKFCEIKIRIIANNIALC